MAQVTTKPPSPGTSEADLSPPSWEGLRLEGELVLLRPAEEKDHDALGAILSDLRTMEHLRFMAYPPQGWSKARVAERLSRRQAQQKAGEALDFLVEMRARPGVVVGECGFTRVSLDHRNADYGIILHHSVWGSGAAAECRLLCLSFAFETLGLHRVATSTSPDNTRVCRFLENLGVPFEGLRKEDIFEEGRFLDSAIYVHFDRDWPQLKERLREKLRRQTGRS